MKDSGYEKPSPVQEQAIPLVLGGRDLMAGAQTGTGKTAAFALPILQRLAPQASTSTSPARHPVRALILTPTRELAIQVEASFREYGKYLPLRTAVVYGGVDMNAQIAQLRLGVEILVATPGRLLDHVQNKTVMFGQVSMLTLDEADRMLDMGFLPDIRRIIALLPKTRQNLLFSATFPDEIKKLASSLLTHPAEVQIAARNAVADLVTHIVHPVAREKKRDLLCHLIRSRNLAQVLVFSGTRIGANRLAHQLRREHIQADAIHGDKSQAERLVALDDFKSGKTAVLVATDVASRGLDIEGLPQVINFDIPRSPEDYVHRIGRTGRAGATGEAISLVSPEDHESLAAIEKLINRKLDRVLVTGFEPDGASVAGLVSREARHAAPRAERAPRIGQARAAKPPADPIFSRPYEPGPPSAGASEPVRGGLPPRRKERQVAALLGGLKRAG
ncbi:MAG: DEAD/DEAH box helicase [Betaproteobacteria bacterium]|nr:DEAD/DEAH box helicase [Betaproteobacteria bacterium]